MLTYFDDRKKLGYLLLNDLRRQEKIREITWTLNEHFTNPDNLKDSLSLSAIKQNMICCTRMSLDNNWYRIKVLQTPSSTKDEVCLIFVYRIWKLTLNNFLLKVVIEYMDYGNEEHVSLSEIKPIPAEFNEYTYMPPQVN